jgi:hypothetical protein
VKDVDKLIEMAIEFSNFSEEDFDDPELQKQLAKQRITIYIPILSNKFWDVMQNGLQINPLRKSDNPRDRDFYLDQTRASDKAHVLGREEGSLEAVPMLLVAEKKILSPVQKQASMVQRVVAMSGVVRAPLIDNQIRPQDIVSVVYPAQGTGWDIPVRKFIQNAKWGRYEPAIWSMKIGGLKTGKASPPPFQYAVLKYVHNILNYSSSYFDYLVGSDQNTLGKAVLREATKLGLAKMWHWTGEDFARWIFKILPPLREPDEGEEFDAEGEIAQMHTSLDHEGFNLPFWKVFKKYQDEFAYEVRSGKRENPDRHD